MKKLIITLVVLAVLAGGGYLTYRLTQPASAAVATLPTAKIERGDLRIVVASTGSVKSNQDVDIKCKASGEVMFLPFDISDQVKKGDVLLKLDTQDQDRIVQKAQAALDGSTALLEQSKQDLAVARQTLVVNRMKADANLLMMQARQRDAHAKLDRERDLLAKKLASQEEYDTAETTAAVSDADLKTAQAQIEDLKTQELALVSKEKDIQVQQANVDQNRVNLLLQKLQIDYATVVSPVDGVVSSLASSKDVISGNPISTRIGSIVQSGTSAVSGGTTVMTISDLSRIFVYATVDESDIGQVQDPIRDPGKPPQKVNITADAYPGVTFEGKVVRVATKGVNSSNVVTFEVRIEVISPNKRLLKPEMTANVEIVKAGRSNVLLLPVQAFTRKRPAAGTDTAATASAPATHAPRTWTGDASHPLHGTVTLVSADGTTQTQDVTVGLTDTNNYEVLSGLKEGDSVVLARGAAESRWRPGMGVMGGGRR